MSRGTRLVFLVFDTVVSAWSPIPFRHHHDRLVEGFSKISMRNAQLGKGKSKLKAK